MKNHNYLGFYYMMGFAINIQEMKRKLVGAMPGVPAGYEIQLEPLAEDKFHMRGGPLDRSLVHFLRNDEGEVTLMKVGDFDFAKISPEKIGVLPVTKLLIAPAYILTREKQIAFQSLLDAILEFPNGEWIQYELPYPKYEFVQYIMNQDKFIFHGSNKRDIEIFAPIRTSVEVYDKKGGIGNLQGVYGTHDGLWSMFFSIVHREQLKGSIRNGVMYFQNRHDEQLAVYNFSINQEQLPEQPWIEGALYVLPRDTFVRQMVTAESYSNEWVSITPVKPLTKLSIQPEDFPFLNQIDGHDDNIVLREQTLAKIIRAAATAAQLQEAQFTVTIPRTEEMNKNLDEFIEIQNMMMPVSQFNLIKSATELILVINSLPPAYQQVFAKMYSELLEK